MTNDQPNPMVLVRGLVGAVVGAVVGYFLFRYLSKNGLYALVLPGAVVGLVGGLAAQGKSQILAILCALIALGVGLYCQWRVHPVLNDESFTVFLRHVPQFPPITLVMLALGTACGYWFGWGR